MKHKHISILLSFILILASALCPGIVSAQKLSSENSQSPSLVLLADLNIIDEDFQVNTSLTRGEFCELLSRTLNSNWQISNEFPYDDVPENHKYYNSIKVMYEWGAISPSSQFRPDDIITPNEAAKMAVSTIGYDFLASSKGGWPLGYMAAAASLKLDVADQMTGAACAQLVYDMLSCRLSSATIVDSNIQYYPGTGDTLLQKIWELNMISGKVTDGQYFGITNLNGVGEGKAVIGGYTFNTGRFDIDGLVGETVDVYYNKKLEICSVYCHDDIGNNCITVYSEEDISYGNGVYEIYNNKTDRNEKIELLPDALIIYNGKRAYFEPDGMIPENGYMKFIKDSSGNADIIIIKEYKEIVAGDIISEEFLVSNKLVSGECYDFSDEKIVMKNQNGDTAYFSDISSGDVIWIAKSADNELTELIISKDIIIGEYTGISSEYVYIDNGEYSVDASAMSNLKSKYIMGDIVTAHINPYGEIVYFEKNNDLGGKKIAYLIESALIGNGLEKNIYIKILCEDGEIETKNLADKFSINLVSFNKDVVSNYSLLPKQQENPSSIQRGIISYYENSDGYVTAINYSGDNLESFGGKKADLTQNGVINGYNDNYVEYVRSGYWITAKSPGRIFVKSSTVVFVVPRAEDILDADDNDYRTEIISSYGSTRNISKRHLTGYTLTNAGDSSDYVVSQYILSSSSQTVSASSSMLMVEKLSTVRTQQGDAKAALTVKNASATSSVFYSDDLDYFENMGLKFGDIIKVSYDSKRNVKGILFVYRPGEKSFRNTSTFSSGTYTEKNGKTILTNNTGMESIATSYLLVGNVYQKGTAGMNLLTLNVDPSAYNGEDLHGYTTNSLKFALCNLKDETIKSGSVSSIKSFEDFGNECSVVVVETRSGHISSMFIYD